MPSRKNDRATSKTLITILTVLCLVMILLTVINEDITAPVRQITGFVMTPLEKGVSSFGRGLSNIMSNFTDSNSLREENEQLRSQIDTLKAENSQLLLNAQELESLKELLDLSYTYSDYETVAAHVISKNTGNWFSTFTIDKGTDAGIQVGCNVIAQSGLAGIVTAAGTGWATVRSIIDDNSNVSAMISSSMDNCIIEGNLERIDEGTLDLIKLQDNDNKVHVGDTVVTSNISEKYLPGILIGYISELGNDSNNLTKSGRIIPVVDFRHIQDVLVIKELKQFVASSGSSNAAAMINDVAQPAEDELDLPDENAGAEDAG